MRCIDKPGTGVSMAAATWAAGSVVDNSTEEFMVRMFERVKKGEPSARALANVKREFLKHDRYSAPAYWAPFVLYGSD